MQRQMISITFLGAARTVTGSKYLVESNGTRIMVDCGAVPGAQGAARAELAGPAGPRVEHRGDRADARAPRSLRLPAAAGVAGIPRPGVLHAGHAGPLQDRAARRRAAAGRRRGVRQPAQLLEAQAGAAALHRSRRLPRRVAAPADRLRPADAGRGRHRSRLHQRGPPARLVVRADARSTDGPCSSAATSDALDGRCCPIRRRSPRRTTSWSNPPTAIACTSRTTTAIASRRSSRTTAHKGGKLIVPAFAIGRVEELIYWLKRLEVGEADSGPAGVRRQPDGRGGAGALHRARPRARSRDAPGRARRQGAARRGGAAPGRGAPAPGDAGARDVRVLHRAVPRHRQRRGVQAADRVEDSRRS